jgi:hypothetical protein
MMGLAIFCVIAFSTIGVLAYVTRQRPETLVRHEYEEVDRRVVRDVVQEELEKNPPVPATPPTDPALDVLDSDPSPEAIKIYVAKHPDQKRIPITVLYDKDKGLEANGFVIVESDGDIRIVFDGPGGLHKGTLKNRRLHAKAAMTPKPITEVSEPELQLEPRSTLRN